jgi:YVTN family beta-propeller protein
VSVSVDPRIGSVLVGYRIEALLGRGGMGVVYRAEDLALERKVALKLLAPELAADARFRERFQRESRLAASLDHPAVVPVYEAGEVQGQLYIAMRYVEGTDLGALLRDRGRLEPEPALDTLTPVADALDEAHERGLVHRDIKPSNVLIDSRGRSYLADFGLTRRPDDHSDLTGAGQLAGSSDYIAPEAIEGRPLDGRSDLYSLGCLLYHCLAGQPPYRRDSELATLWAHVHDPPPTLDSHPELDPVLATALAKDPAKRHPSARALVEAARQALPTPKPPPRRHKLLLAAATALVAIAVAAILAVVLTRGGDDGPSSTPTATPTTASIQRIDADTNQLIATISVPVSPFALAAGGGSVWAANRERNEIYRIDPGRNRVVATIQGSGNPAALSYGAGSLWVLNPSDGIVTRIDPESNTILDTIPLPPGSWVINSGLDASEHGVWAAWATAEANALRIDPLSTAAVPKLVGPSEQVYDFESAGPSLLWVASDAYGLLKVDPRGDDLSEVDTTDHQTVGDLSADSRGVWQAFSDSDRVVHFDAETLRVDREVSVGDDPWGIATGFGAVWVSNVGDGTVSRVDPESQKVVATIPVGPDPWKVVVAEDSVWVAVHPALPAVNP